MPKPREDWYFDEKRKKIVGRFHDFRKGRYVPERDLAPLLEVMYLQTTRGKRTRSSKEQARYCQKLWNAEFQKIKEHKEAQPDPQTDAEKYTLNEAIELYLKQMPSSIYYVRDMTCRIKYWKEKIGDKKLQDITPAVLVKERSLLKQSGKAPATVNHYLSALSALFQFTAQELFWVTSNPCSQVKRIPLENKRTRYLDENELKRLMKAVQHRPDLELAVSLALATGGRQSEIWGLCWKDLDLKRGIVTFYKTKNKEIRSVPLVGSCLQKLKAFRKTRRLDTDCLFPSESSPQNFRSFRRCFKTALKNAQIEEFRWHDLRHTTASHLAMQGVPLLTIAAILGHKTLSMTQRYAHLSPEHLKESIATLDSALFQG